MPGRYGPMLVAPLMPSVMGSMLEFRTVARAAAYRLYISGDTLVYRDLKEIRCGTRIWILRCCAWAGRA